MTLSEKCVFCRVKPEERIIRERELFVSFLSNPRIKGKVGHSLVVPRRHVTNITELEPPEIAALFTETQRVQQRVLGQIATGCDVWVKYQPEMPEDAVKVNHMHVHVIPRDASDRVFMLSSDQDKSSQFENISDHERDTITTILGD